MRPTFEGDDAVSDPNKETPMAREWKESMGEISGFGGGYEAACRSMVLAGIAWIDANPEADPQFHGFRGIYGVIQEDNADAEALTKAIIDASGGDATGAMHQASVSHVLAYKRLGWDEYVRQLETREREEADA